MIYVTQAQLKSLEDLMVVNGDPFFLMTDDGILSTDAVITAVREGESFHISPEGEVTPKHADSLTS